MTVTSRMREIFNAYSTGTSIEDLGRKYNISSGSVQKKIIAVERNDKLLINHNTPNVIHNEQNSQSKWSYDKINEGILRFIAENRRTPTSIDFDETPYLPSARQVQRAFGGMVGLRKHLGFTDLDFTKGDLRKEIATSANKRGLEAENYLEALLIQKFGEPFVHVQKRYYSISKNRYDFFIYAENVCFGVDIFATDRASYIEKNIRHKLKRYKDVPPEIPIYFVLAGDDYTSDDVLRACASVIELSKYPHIATLTLKDFVEKISNFEALKLPSNFKGIIS